VHRPGQKTIEGMSHADLAQFVHNILQQQTPDKAGSYEQVDVHGVLNVKDKLNLSAQARAALLAGTLTSPVANASLAGYPWTNADIASAAAISASKLAGYPSDATKVLKGDGSWGVPSSSSSAVKYTTLRDVGNSTTETDILQAAGYSIPGNTLGASGGARITIGGDLLYNNSTADTFQLKVYFGGAVIFDGGAITPGSVSLSSSRRGWYLQLVLQNLGATNSQLLHGLHVLGATGLPATGISGDTWPRGGTINVLQASAATDTTAAQTLRVTAKWGTASANDDLRAKFSIIEFV
jgi:hypothetical protein